MDLNPDPTRYRSSDEQWGAEAKQVEEYMSGPLEPIALFGCIAGLYMLSQWPWTTQPTKDP